MVFLISGVKVVLSVCSEVFTESSLESSFLFQGGGGGMVILGARALEEKYLKVFRRRVYKNGEMFIF